MNSLLKIHICWPPSWIIRDVNEAVSLFARKAAIFETTDSRKCEQHERCFVRLTYLSNLYVAEQKGMTGICHEEPRQLCVFTYG